MTHPFRFLLAILAIAILAPVAVVLLAPDEVGL